MKKQFIFCLLIILFFPKTIPSQERKDFALYKGEKLYYSAERPRPGKYSEDLRKLIEDYFLSTEYGDLLVPKGSIIHSFENRLTSLSFIDNERIILNIFGILFYNTNSIYFNKPNQGISSIYSQNPEEIQIGKYLLSPRSIEIDEWENVIWRSGEPPPYNNHKTITLSFSEFPDNILLEDGTEIIISSINFMVQLKILMDIDTGIWYLERYPIAASTEVAKVEKLKVKRANNKIYEYDSIIIHKDWAGFISGK
jgi:hypothetical protein